MRSSNLNSPIVGFSRRGCVFFSLALLFFFLSLSSFLISSVSVLTKEFRLEFRLKKGYQSWVNLRFAILSAAESPPSSLFYFKICLHHSALSYQPHTLTSSKTYIALTKCSRYCRWSSLVKGEYRSWLVCSRYPELHRLPSPSTSLPSATMGFGLSGTYPKVLAMSTTFLLFFDSTLQFVKSSWGYPILHATSTFRF